ncbi:MAG: hypothetical protein HY868_25660 [Chloroflexi bacterium]|nr:hypothetical protein [Chloroflexota bacterium]
MEAIRLHQVIEKDGEILVTGLPFRKGQHVEMIVLPDAPAPSERPPLTVRALLESGLIGMWKDRDDIGDSAEFARKLREQAQRRW